MDNAITDWAVEVEDLHKRFGPKPAVDGISLRVRRGCIYGVLGPNGAGKTTTLRMLATLLTPDTGRARVLGYDVVAQPQAVRSRISLTGQFASVDEDLSGLENLVLLARLLGFRGRRARVRAEQLLDAFALSAASRQQVKTFSGGMRRRLDIAASLIVAPELVFLDEPTTGLDPRSRNQVWSIVRALVDAGTTVLLTTQYLEEADQLAERIAVFEHGKVIAEGTSRELKAATGSGVLHIRLTDPKQRERAAELITAQLGPATLLDGETDALSVQVQNNDDATRALAQLPQAGIALASYSLGQPSLDEVFLALTGHEARGDTPAEASEIDP